eukprot:GHVR01141475.1.p1 GENE.GHVR01141475.1~~GHVR01141475.1.p1  ORF type:complete len:198 (+),score=33.11 GHVR01141475.1:424-1017(+)
MVRLVLFFFFMKERRHLWIPVSILLKSILMNSITRFHYAERSRAQRNKKKWCVVLAIIMATVVLSVIGLTITSLFFPNFMPFSDSNEVDTKGTSHNSSSSNKGGVHEISSEEKIKKRGKKKKIHIKNDINIKLPKKAKLDDNLLMLRRQITEQSGKDAERKKRNKEEKKKKKKQKKKKKKKKRRRGERKKSTNKETS